MSVSKVKSIKPFNNMVGDHYDPSAERDNVSKIKLKLQDIQDAHKTIQNHIVITPVIQSKHIAKGILNLYFKCENLQYTGSYKARGACNLMSCMSPYERTKGCTIAGGRNFLYAMTHYGFKQSVPVNVVVPKDCPLVDRQRYKEDFAIVKLYGDNQGDANLKAISYASEIGSNYIHGSDRLDLLAGYGTLGLELLSQIDKIDAVICPVGSGDLVASLILGIKSLKPSCLIYGVESSSAPTMSRALQENTPVLINSSQSIADSLSAPIASTNAFNIIKGYMDRMMTVDETWISKAVLQLLEREKMMVEPAAACPVAAIMAGKVPELRKKNVVCILSGGNMNSLQLPLVIDRGLAAEGRLVRFAASVADEPGAVARLIARATEAGAAVKAAVPERDWMRKNVHTTTVNMLMETMDINHTKELEKKLTKQFPKDEYLRIAWIKNINRKDWQPNSSTVPNTYI